jgi:hypothetical protein
LSTLSNHSGSRAASTAAVTGWQGARRCVGVRELVHQGDATASGNVHKWGGVTHMAAVLHDTCFELFQSSLAYHCRQVPKPRSGRVMIICHKVITLRCKQHS